MRRGGGKRGKRDKEGERRGGGGVCQSSMLSF